MARFIPIAAASLLGAILAACQAAPVPQAERLDGIDWKLMQVNGMPWSHDVSLRLDYNRLTGVLPCNAYSGTRGGTAPAFAAHDLDVTGMACSDPGRRQAEAEYLGLLPRAISIRRDGAAMVLSGPDTQLVFEPREARGDEVF